MASLGARATEGLENRGGRRVSEGGKRFRAGIGDFCFKWQYSDIE